MEAGLAQSGNGNMKVRQALAGSGLNYAERSGDGQMPAFGFEAPTGFVDRDLVGGKFLGEQDGVVFFVPVRRARKECLQDVDFADQD